MSAPSRVFERTVLVVLVAGFGAVTVVRDLSVRIQQQFVYLAQSFLEGTLYFSVYREPYLDTVLANGRHYWPLGPFPAVLLIPPVAIFGDAVRQGWLQIPLVALVGWLAFRAARRAGFSPNDASWLAFAFCFASIFLGPAMTPMSWYYAHVVSVALFFLAIEEHATRRRWWVVGLLVGLVFATRASAALCGVYFVALRCREQDGRVLRDLLRFAAPAALVAAAVLGYNAARFGDPLESGYAMQWLRESRSHERDEGLFDPSYVPRNAYDYFVAPPGKPEPLVVRVNLWVVSPLFLFLVAADWRRPEVRWAIAASLPALAMILAYYATGMRFGPRYLLDVLPLWYLALLTAFRGARLHWPHKLLVTASALIDLALLVASTHGQAFTA